MKKFRIFLLSMFAIPCVLMFGGCSLLSSNENSNSPNRYIIEFIQSGTTLSENQYTIIYSDGTSETITIPKKITLESQITLAEIRAYCEQEGKDFDTYMSEHLVVDYDGVPAITLAQVEKYCEDNSINFDDYMSEHMTITMGNGMYISMSDIESYCSKNNIEVSDFFKNYCDVLVSNDKLAVNTALSSALIIAAKGSGVGSGFVYKMEESYSYIVTCEHVVDGASAIYAYQYGAENEYFTDYNRNFSKISSKAITCDYVGGANTYDVAVLKVPTASLVKNNPNVCAVSIADSYDLADTVYVVGNAEGEGLSANKGIINVASETKTNENGSVLREMRIDAPVNHGNSGCGLFNIDGQIVGLVNAKYQSVEIDDMGFAIPMDNFTKVADNIIYAYESGFTVSNVAVESVYRVDLNVEYGVTSTQLTYNNGIYGLFDQVVITNCETTSLGYAVGLRVGDVVEGITITRTGDSNETITKTFNRYYEFKEYCLTLKVGDKIKYAVKRGEQSITTKEYVINLSHFVQEI